MTQKKTTQTKPQSKNSNSLNQRRIRIAIVLAALVTLAVLLTQITPKHSTTPPSGNNENLAFIGSTRAEFTAFDAQAVSTSGQAAANALTQEATALGLISHSPVASSHIDSCFTQPINQGWVITSQIKHCHIRNIYIYGADSSTDLPEWLTNALNAQEWKGAFAAKQDGSRQGSFNKQNQAIPHIDQSIATIHLGSVATTPSNDLPQNDHSNYDSVSNTEQKFDETKASAAIKASGKQYALRVVLDAEYYAKEYWHQ